MSSLLKFKATLDQGKAQANQFNAQARQTELQGRVQAIEYQTEANNALSNLEHLPVIWTPLRAVHLRT